MGFRKIKYLINIVFFCQIVYTKFIDRKVNFH